MVGGIGTRCGSKGGKLTAGGISRTWNEYHFLGFRAAVEDNSLEVSSVVVWREEKD